MKKNFWEVLHGASRRRKDKALLAALERDTADGERIAAANARKADADAAADLQRFRIARAFGREPSNGDKS